MVGAQAQQDYGMDNRYNSYKPGTEYLSQYADKKYSSYEPEYGIDNNNYQKSYGEDRYGPTEYSDNNYYNSYEQDYGMDNDNRKSYETIAMNQQQAME